MSRSNYSILLEKLISQLQMYPASTYSKVLEIEDLADTMTKELDDSEFDALVALLSELEESCNKQVRLINSVKVLLNIKIDKN